MRNASIPTPKWMRNASSRRFSSDALGFLRETSAKHLRLLKRVVERELAMGEEALPVLQQEKEASKPAAAKPKVSCVPKADALWFCYSPVYQMTEYYREGTFDNCYSKWSELFDCLSLKTKRADQIQAILEEQERERARKNPHIWEFRTPEEAAKHWKEEFGHLQE